MLQRETSATTSSKSATNKGAAAATRPANPLDTHVQFVKGVGPKLGSVFISRGLGTVRDLLTFFPRAYEDRSKLLQVKDLQEGQTATVPVQVLSVRKVPLRTGKTMLEVRVGDGTGTILLKWFHAPRGMESRFTQGAQIMVTGQVKFFMNRPTINHPEINWSANTTMINAGRVVPIYTELENIPSRVFRKVLWEAIQKYLPMVSEDLPRKYLQAHQLPTSAQAIREIHFPPETAASAEAIQQLIEFETPAHSRLIYEEFFKFEYLVLKRKLQLEKEHAPRIGSLGGEKALSDLTGALPFKLTGDQKKSIDEIMKDLRGDLSSPLPSPMNRLIQGDVGSGKTAVALLTAGAAIAEGGQCALMAPTEILAEQHFQNATRLFGNKLNPFLLTGKTPQSERNKIQQKLAAGEPLLLIGTHALIEDPVQFKNLVYVLIDEQHRFGVEQRRILRRKGKRPDSETGLMVQPHTLILTATPIPRTLALTAYGDLSVSTIRELPPGRTPIKTQVVRKEDKSLAFERIRDEIKSGRQAYFIYPLVNDSEAEGFTSLKSAVSESERLAKDVFPEFKVGLLHGQMRPDEKARIMDEFKRNEIQILVSTTVVEVGVDVPNATVMVVEHAERFGLSQLHQLRGRVGRGSHQSYCFLLASGKLGETSAYRLDVLEQTQDGFKIAEADLEIRGPGEFLGTRQSGGLPFRMADLVRDREWLLKARDDVQDLIRQDPELKSQENLPLRRYYEREGSLQFEWLKTS